MVKTCTRCGVDQPFSEYTKHKLGRDGLRPRCKTCTALENADYRARTSEQRTAYNKRYRAENRERHLAANTAWNQANRERMAAAYRRYRKNHPDQVAADKRRRREKIKNTRHRSYTTAAREQARIAYYGERCYYCGAPWEELDHRIPLSRGGQHLPSNLVPACGSCNNRKHSRTEREFLASPPRSASSTRGNATGHEAAAA